VFGDTSVVAASGNQISSNLSDEFVILNLKTGVYYGLDKVGARVWTLIQEPKTLVEIRDVILDEYEVEPERCANDLQVLLQDMAAKGLIEVR
jgi:hypothetical protein